MYSCTKMYTSAFIAKSGLATAIPTNTSTICVLKIIKSLNYNCSTYSYFYLSVKDNLFETHRCHFIGWWWSRIVLHGQTNLCVIHLSMFWLQVSADAYNRNFDKWLVRKLVWLRKSRSNQQWDKKLMNRLQFPMAVMPFLNLYQRQALTKELF